MPDPAVRLHACATRWGLEVEPAFETPTSLIAFGRRGGDPVALKIIKAPGDEWDSGDVLAAFGGRGTVRVYEREPGAMLIERLSPGDSLVALSQCGRDDEATAILADVMLAMTPDAPPAKVATIAEWGRGFDRARGLDAELVADAAARYRRLLDSQTDPRLLHGDLQHSNVLFDAARGWTAIDPKGVIGELEFEIGAALRNPVEAPALYADPIVVRRRVQIFAERLRLDARRILEWGFAQAVLSAIWEIEDGLVGIRPRSLAFAEIARSIQFFGP